MISSKGLAFGCREHTGTKRCPQSSSCLQDHKKERTTKEARDKKKRPHSWGHYLKRQKRREVREDFARYHPETQNGDAGFVEKNG